MTKYEVTNLAKDTRKFRDGWLGKDILVEPNKTVITNRPPKESEIWKIENHIEKTEKIYNKKGGKQKKMEIKKTLNLI